jgi:hypothetical protein
MILAGTGLAVWWRRSTEIPTAKSSYQREEMQRFHGMGLPVGVKRTPMLLGVV